MALFVNSAKSFTMVFTKSPKVPTCHITVHGSVLEQVNRFIYLGSLITSDGRAEHEIRRRISIAKATFTTMEKVLKSTQIELKIRIRVLKCYVWSTLLYCTETWTISSAMMKMLNAAEMWFFRRMLKIPWSDKVTNEEVLRRAHSEKALLNEIVRRQMKFFGHVIRKDEVENLVITGFIEGTRARGRQRETFLTYLNKMKETSPIELIRLARKRNEWRELTK